MRANIRRASHTNTGMTHPIKKGPRWRGCGRLPTLAFYGVKAGYRGIEIETIILGVAGDNSRSTAGNFDDISVGHVSFLLLASVSTQISGHTSRLTEPNANAGMTRSAGATVSFKRNLGENRLASAMVRVVGIGYGFEHRIGAGNAAAIERQTGLSMRSPRRGCGGTSSTLEMGSPVPCH